MTPGWIKRPAMRRLRVYALDPGASLALDTAFVNDAVIEIPWETPWEDPVALGPINDYLEVIDYDPACGVFYEPVDLNHPHLLAQDGLAPSEGRPQFHQQMVFAIAMKTIRSFERALGRTVLWAQPGGGKPPEGRRRYCKKLRIYPHALREAIAYYSPDKAALLFGYFQTDGPEGEADGEWVFTCLSQDIVAHEIAHAILHGLQQRTLDASNPDMLAFHEAFADIVALFEHFTMIEILEHQIARSSGSLRVNNLLTGLAGQFGRATGRAGPLRHALEMVEAEATESAAAESSGAAAPKRHQLSDTWEPHARGQFLVAAVFDAFVKIYEHRTADLFRLAAHSPRSARAMPQELVHLLAKEAAKAADHVLRMCVRGLDYLPPVDFTFGEYLRAIITADADLVPNDSFHYRVAMAEAFRNRGIPVPGCISYAPESLMWQEPDAHDLPLLAGSDRVSGLFADVLQHLELNVGFGRPGGDGRSSYASSRSADFAHRNLREEAIRIVEHNQYQLWKWLMTPSVDPDTGKKSRKLDEEWEQLVGIKMFETELASVFESSTIRGFPAVSVNSARIARRQGPDGQELHQLVIHVTQRRRGYFDLAEQAAADKGRFDRSSPRWEDPDFIFRGGATLIVDLRDGRLRRLIRKRIDDDDRLERHRSFLTDSPLGVALSDRQGGVEPFALVHGS